ncbi:MAG: sulfite exporter TauE/SafE family protein [Mucilaginibacter sp.]|nr:sulfite exporter TauE/SafE family protein [Mucilaginibacter sp.]
MNVNEIAFFVGLFGSLHCIGMCGPLAFAIPASQKGWLLLLTDKFLYNLGRVLSYTTLGFLIGFIGRQLWISGLQQGISLASGLLIVLAGFSRMFKLRLFNSTASSKLLAPISKAINYAIQHRAGNFAVGVLNGFLPCGFVYLALVGAVNTASPLSAAQYMFWFGAGTFPLMLAATVSSGFMNITFRRRVNDALPYLMVCLGFWFILRGMDLNIPYLSPAVKNAAGICK